MDLDGLGGAGEEVERAVGSERVLLLGGRFRVGMNAKTQGRRKGAKRPRN